MASAGRILIIPRGEYDANTQYGMLDLVSYNGKGWICKADCKGVAPVEGKNWSVMFDASEIVEELNESLGKRNLQTYTDIAQIGGKVSNTVAELFALLPINSELIYFVGNSSTDALNKSLPLTLAGELSIRKNALDTRGVAIYKPYELNQVYENHYRNGFLGWERLALNSDLANYLLKTGGDLTGDVRVDKSKSTDTARMSVVSKTKELRLIAEQGGTCGLYDATNEKYIVMEDTKGNVTLNGNASYADKADKANSASVYLGDSAKQCDQIRIRACSASEPYNGFIYLQQRDDGTIEVGLNGRGGVGVHLADKAKCDGSGNVIANTYAKNSDLAKIGSTSYGYNSNIAKWSEQGNQVGANMSITKYPNNKCDIHIQGRIIARVYTGTNTYDNGCMLYSAICSTLGIKSFAIENARQTFANVYKESGEKLLTGTTGLLFYDAGSGYGFGYFDNDNLMPLGLSSKYYNEGNFFDVHIYGATYS